jgi:hypothetical protein
MYVSRTESAFFCTTVVSIFRRRYLTAIELRSADACRIGSFTAFCFAALFCQQSVGYPWRGCLGNLLPLRVRLTRMLSRLRFAS